MKRTKTMETTIETRPALMVQREGGTVDCYCPICHAVVAMVAIGDAAIIAGVSYRRVIESS